MLILASSSPRRQELLKKITKDFIIIVPSVDERLLDSSIKAKDMALEESRIKAYEVFSKHPDDEVLASDTIVLLNGKILGKPIDEEDAIRMLKEEQGKKQIVFSGYTYLSKGKEVSRSVSTAVYFNKLSDEQIIDYVKKYQPFGKAGAYGIQDEAGLIDHIEGSYYNVMGFPIEDIKKHLPQLGKMLL
jgi:septum formation protein